MVVGVDGSPGSRAALEYAMAEAARRGALLRVVAGVTLPEFWATSYGMYLPPPPGDIVEDARKELQRFVDEAAAARSAATGTPPISVEARAGRAGDVLVDAAEGADLLVVGHRGRGALSSVLIGSVGLYCLLHADCPVTVVPAGPDRVETRQRRNAEMNETVVVGVDGSPAARAVLEYAMEEAARRDARCGWSPRWRCRSSGPPTTESWFRHLRTTSSGRRGRQTQRFVDEVVAAHGDAARGVPIKVEIRAGRPGEVLVDAAEGAALLVVGHRGLGSVASVLLGSVGLHCVLHATCPVTVVRPKAVRADEPVRGGGRAAGAA